MPHTYQVRDFVPKLATAMGRTVISDCIGYRKEGDKLLFTRQMFQGKFAADVSFNCDPPWFVTFQNGAFRGDRVEAGASAAPGIRRSTHSTVMPFGSSLESAMPRSRIW